MNLIKALKSEVSKVEFYASKKPKYNKEEQAYQFDNDTIVSLNTFDTKNSLDKLFLEVMQNDLTSLIEEKEVKDYSNQEFENSHIYTDTSVDLDTSIINANLCSIALIEKESVSLDYLLIKVVSSSNEDILIWYKLKSALKIENNLLNYQKNEIQIQINKDGITYDNYPKFEFDLSSLAFICYDEEFYIFDKSLYQKYFSLENYYFYLANKQIDSNENIISDCNVITKGNAKFVCEYFDNITKAFSDIQINKINTKELSNSIYELNLGLDYNSEDNTFILKKPQDVKDLILLCSGCLGINKLTNEKFKVKKPNSLE